MPSVFKPDLRYRAFSIAVAVAGALALPACGNAGAAGLSGAGAGQTGDACPTFALKLEGCGVPPNAVGCPSPCGVQCYEEASCKQVLAGVEGGPAGTLATCLDACASSGHGSSGSGSGSGAGGSGSGAGSGSGPTGSSSGSAGSGFKCLVTSGSCICLDPAPDDYTSTTCPSFSCCYRISSGSPRECTCAPFTGQQCDDWRAGAAPTASCP